MRVLKILCITAIAVMTPFIGNAYAMQLAPSPGAALQYSLTADMAQTATVAQPRALWSMYPASVRGRVFGGTGDDPLQGGGGW